MTGPEHYAEAERLLAQADTYVSENMAHQTGEHKADMLAAAQVHATLALAAAVAADKAVGPAASSGWRTVATEWQGPTS